MKKYIILFFIVIALVLLNYWILFYYQSSSKSKVQINTGLVIKNNSFSKSLLKPKSDFTGKISKIKSDKFATLSAEDKIRHVLALGYVDLSYVYISIGKYELAKEFRNSAFEIAGNNDPEVYAKVLNCGGLKYQLQTISGYNYTNEERVQVLSDKVQSELFQANSAFVFTANDLPQNNKKIFPYNFYISGQYWNINMKYEYLMMCEQHLGTVCNLMARYNKAIDWYAEALTLAKELDLQLYMAKLQSLTGETYMQMGDYKNANLAFIQLLNTVEKYGNKKQIANAYRSMGELHFLTKEYSPSLIYYIKAVQNDTSIQLNNEAANDYARISSIYFKQRQMSKAVAYCSMALQSYQKANNRFGVSESNRTLGDLYFQLEEYNISHSFYLKALEQKKRINNQKDLAIFYSYLSEIYATKPVKTDLYVQNLQYAMTYGIQGYQIAERLNITSIMKDAAGCILIAYKKLKSFGKTFLFLEIIKPTNNNKYSKSTNEALIFAQALLNNENKKQEIVSLKSQIKTILAQKKGETKRHNNLVFELILVFGMGAISTVMFWLYSYKQREIIQQQEFSRISLLRLQNIRNRISPHFIFNFLNHEISAQENNEKNQSMVGIVTFLRRSLEIAEKIYVTLNEEMDFVKNYLMMEQNSLEDEIKVEWDVDNRIDLKSFKIPAMMIQIPVENALKHALRPKNGEKLLLISIMQVDNNLTISILDNGDGYHPERLLVTKGTGTGLKVLYQTIQILNTRNDEKIKLNIADVTGELSSGTKVEVTIPKRYNYDI